MLSRKYLYLKNLRPKRSACARKDTRKFWVSPTILGGREEFMARPRRFERPTLAFGGQYSIQLSYGRVRRQYSVFCPPAL